MANTKPLSRRQLNKLPYRQVVAEWRRQSILKAKRGDVKQKPKGKN